jgi:hypothetical protein
MEHTMSTANFDFTARLRRLFGRPVMIGSGAGVMGIVGIVIGLTPGLLFPTAKDHPIAHVSANVGQPVSVPESVTFRIVPSPVIEANARFFFGTGDGSNGDYAERPNR